MKLRIEISDSAEDEVIIRARELNGEVKRIQNAIEASLGALQMSLTSGNSEYFIPTDEILFFETGEADIAAHTADRMYYFDGTLCRLEKILPRYFVRVSKSCILNSAKVESVCRGVTGTAEARFYSSVKKAYISRMYYKILKETIYVTRILK